MTTVPARVFAFLWPHVMPYLQPALAKPSGLGGRIVARAFEMANNVSVVDVVKRYHWSCVHYLNTAPHPDERVNVMI
jgi:hypothetical protein